MRSYLEKAILMGNKVISKKFKIKIKNAKA